MVLKSVSPKVRPSGYGLTVLMNDQTDFSVSSTLIKSHQVISHPMSNKFFFKYWISSPSLYRLKKL